MPWVSPKHTHSRCPLRRHIVCTALTVLALSRRDARRKARAEAQNQDIPATLSAEGSAEDLKLGKDDRVVTESNVVEVEELQR